MKKKILCFVVGVLILACRDTKSIAAQKDILSPVTCEYGKDGTLTVSGNGVLKENAVGDRTEDDGVGIGVKRVIIEEGITEMEDYCLGGFIDMTDLELPDSLQKIGNQAFMGCEKLKKVELPSEISEIPKACFSGCKSLEEVVIPEELTAIRKDAFKGCQRLKQLIVPEKLMIWENPIAKCPALKKIVNHSAQSLELDVCEGNKTWYVKGKHFYISSGDPKVIGKLKKNRWYYFEIAYTEIDADDDDYESNWVGKRGVVINK